jgi:hypothetical protein
MASTAVKLARTETGDSGDLALSARIEFYACLQLLAERARYITGATWAAVAIGEGTQFMYRAGVGADSPQVGSVAEVRPEAMITDAGRFQPGKALIVPAMRESEISGFLQLQSEAGQFGEQEFQSVLRLAAMLSTAIDHLKAAENSQALVLSRTKEQVKSEGALLWHAPAGERKDTSEDSALLSREVSVRVCESCGFPVSDGRSVCVDCESRGVNATPSLLQAAEKTEPWFSKHGYTIASLLVPAAAAAILYWLR